MATTATYNGVSIDYIRIGSVRTEAVYDESNTILTGWRTIIDMNGLIQARTRSDFIEALQDAQSLLLEPRKTLLIKFDTSDTWLNVQPAGSGSGADVDQGPKPLAVTVTEFAGGRAASVSWVVQFTLPPDLNTSPVVLSHRWEQQFQVDEKNLTERTVVGDLVLSSAAAASALTNPDRYRDIIYPPYIPGFRRVSAQFAVSRSGTRLAYRITDREEFRPYPGRALVGNGTFTAQLNGASVTKVFSITLTGAKGVPPGQLLISAFNALRTRINVNQGGGDQVLSVQITENLFENTVTLQALAQGLNEPGLALLGANTRLFGSLEAIGDPKPEGHFNQPTPFGSALIRAAAAPLFDAPTDGMASGSTPPDLDTAEVEATTEDSPGTLVVEVEAPDDDFLESDTALAQGSSNISNAQLDGTPYLEVQQRVALQVDNQMVVLAPASSAASSVVQQLRAPRVAFHHAGVLKRMGVAPVLPTPVVPSGGFVESYEARPTQPTLSANKQAMVYGLEYRFTVVLPFYSSSDQFTTFTDGTLGKLTRFGGSEGVELIPPKSPAIASATDLDETIIPVGWSMLPV
jgi:hypothetical protein